MSYSDFLIELKKALVENTDFAHEIIFMKSNNAVTDKYSICVPEFNTLAVPSMGLDYFYDEYEKGRNIEEIADKIEEIYLSKLASEDKPNLVWESVKNHLIYQLVNFSNNEKSLMQCPYFQIGDMAVIFKINTLYLGIDGYITVTYEVYEMLKVNLISLVEAALVNTPEISPINLVKLNDILPDFNAGSSSGSTRFNTFEFWIAGTTTRQNGAAVILYKELHNLLKKQGYSDAYIIPLSIHEALVVGYSEDVNKEILQDMLTKSNASPLITKESHLSDRVYLYSELVNKFEKKIKTLKSNILL